MIRRGIAWAPAFQFLAVGILGTVLAYYLMSTPPGVQCAAANPANFCYRTNLAVTNSTGADLTNYPIRFPFPAAAVIAADHMDAYAWDLRAVTPGNEDVEIFAQDLSGGTATWWLVAPTIPDGATVTFKLYTVLTPRTPGDQGHDPGFFFSTSATSTVAVANHADFDLTDRIGVQVTVENDGDPPPTSPAWFLSKHDGASGYGLGIVDVGGVLRVRFQIDSATTDSILWDGSLATIRGEFISPNLFLYIDGGLVSSTSTGPGTAGTSTAAVIMGDDFDGTLREARVVSNVGAGNAVVSRWGFEPQNATETVDTLPYQGTIGDNVGAHPATYTLGWDQTGITLALSAQALTETAATLSYDPEAVGIMGGAFTTDPFEDTGCSPNTRFPMYGRLSALCTLSGLPTDGCFIAIFTTVGLIALLIVAYYSPFFFISAVPMLLILSIGAGNCFYSFWYVFLWGMLGLGALGVRVVGRTI